MLLFDQGVAISDSLSFIVSDKLLQTEFSQFSFSKVCLIFILTGQKSQHKNKDNKFNLTYLYFRFLEILV